MMRARFSTLAGVALGSLLALTAFAAETFEARITMVPIDMTMRATVTGQGASTAVLDGRRLVVKGTFSGMRSPATTAQLRAGPFTGVRGPVIQELRIDAAPAGTFSGEIDLSPEQIQNLRNGRLYIQIQSQGAPEGNLWGWFLR